MLEAMPRRRWVERTLAATLTPVALRAQAQPQPAACPALLQHAFARLQDDKPEPLCQYAGKVLLIVNTASYCGYTPQYKGLEALHSRFSEKGLAVMGYPSNDFGQQEPGDSKQIGELCFNTYGVRFPMFAKTVVAGKDAHPLFQALAKATGQAPRWNFHKYLVDRKGQVLGSFASEVRPEDAGVVGGIARALAL